MQETDYCRAYAPDKPSPVYAQEKSETLLTLTIRGVWHRQRILLDWIFTFTADSRANRTVKAKAKRLNKSSMVIGRTG